MFARQKQYTSEGAFWYEFAPLLLTPTYLSCLAPDFVRFPTRQSDTSNPTEITSILTVFLVFGCLAPSRIVRFQTFHTSLDQLFCLFGDRHFLICELQTKLLQFFDFSQCRLVRFLLLVCFEILLLFVVEFFLLLFMLAEPTRVLLINFLDES